MFTHHETERLKQVYRAYRHSRDFQAKQSLRNLGNRAIVRERQRRLKQILRSAGYLSLTQYRILDVGCGDGQFLVGLRSWGAQPQNLYGVDLLAERIEAAQQQFPQLHFEQGNAEQLNFSANSFDLVCLFTVFSSILDKSMADNVAQEVQRVLKPGGAIIWYDFRYNNPSNPNVRGVNKREICALFPNFNAQLQTVTLLPPLARRLDMVVSVLYPLLSVIPWLRTHYLGLLLKPTKVYL